MCDVSAGYSKRLLFPKRKRANGAEMFPFDRCHLSTRGTALGLFTQFMHVPGVVHLASTESTGGSTTGDDEESSDQQQGVDKVLLETRRNTYQNESIANSYRQAQEKLGWSNDCDSQPENGNSLYPPSLTSFPPRPGKPRRDKSPSDLEADDENDHDSLNQSETGSTLSLSGATATMTTVTSSTVDKPRPQQMTNSNTPVIRPTTPTGKY